MNAHKPIKCLVLDASPLLLNNPSISSLFAKTDRLYTTPSVIAEIKDPVARARLETTVLPFLEVQDPSPKSIKFVADFSKKTGDYAVLSRTDLQLLALAYELECEQNAGDWRLRSRPGQKGTNGSPPASLDFSHATNDHGRQMADGAINQQSVSQDDETLEQAEPAVSQDLSPDKTDDMTEAQSSAGTTQLESLVSSARALVLETTERTRAGSAPPDSAVHDQVSDLHLEQSADSLDASNIAEEEDDDDEEGWITPSNVAKHKNIDAESATTSSLPNSDPYALSVATITQDFPLQNVLLQLNLTLLSSSTLSRIKTVKSHVMRCYACFNISRDLTKQFCPRCGGPNLTKVSCSTNANTGAFVLHMKKNFQYNRRGDRYSIPKPTHGSASGKQQNVHGGGKGGWAQGLVLAEDQKEYARAREGYERRREKDLMDQDSLPGLLSGKRDTWQEHKPRVGVGRDINTARKRK